MSPRADVGGVNVASRPDSRERSRGASRAMRAIPWTLGAAAAGYGLMVAYAWWSYGRPRRSTLVEKDAWLDEFMPVYDVVERHSIYVDAPPDVTLRAAEQTNLFESRIVRAVFRTREWFLGAQAGARPRTGLIEFAESLGWGVLAVAAEAHEVREIVMGAVTQPWLPDVTFQSVPPKKFRDFAVPGYVKIAWTLRADRVGEHGSIFRTETRAVATDDAARARFRTYWSRVSPGVWVIRRLMLMPVRRNAERRWRVNTR